MTKVEQVKLPVYVINKYKNKPIWVAKDIDGNVVTFEGCISTNLPCDYSNAHDFIIAQLIKVDSISKFVNQIGFETETMQLFRDFTKNDRNLSYWENLATNWFGAKWMMEA